MTLEQPDISINPKNHKVMAWLSPSFPIGAFAYSHGLEFEISVGNISRSNDLYYWLSDILQYGSYECSIDCSGYPNWRRGGVLESLRSAVSERVHSIDGASDPI